MPRPNHVRPPGRAAWTTAITLALVALLSLIASSLPPAPSARGRIAFQTNRDGNWEIYVMEADGTGQTRLTDDPAEDWLPRWVPPQAGARASQLVVVSNRDRAWHIYLLDVGPTALAASPPAAAWRASDYGRAIDTPAHPSAPAATRLSRHTENNWDPAVSPDGRSLAFSALDGRQRDVHLAELDTGATRNLTRHPAEDWLPAWAPDGRQLAFVTDRDGNFDIYRLDLASGSLSNLTHHAAQDWVPAWSPTGRELAFQSDRDGNWEIYVLDLVTGRVRNLTRHAADDWDPAWSPDGRQIVFMSWRDGNREIYAMDARDGSGLSRLTHSPAADKNPSWTW